MAQRLVFVVEGDSEVAFINNKLIPYLYANGASGWMINAQKITTNRKRNARGGNVNFEYLRNEIKRIGASKEPWITTFLDFFRLPTDFPGFTTDGARIGEIEKAVYQELGYSKLIPYIQKYEFETLLFADITGFSNIAGLTPEQQNSINAIVQQYPDIEDINGGPETAPSKRLQAIFNYNKVSDSQIILSDIPVEAIIEKSRKFGAWVQSLLRIINAS